MLRTGLRRDLGDVISKRNSWEVLERDLQVSSSSKWTADAGGVDVSHGHHHVRSTAAIPTHKLVVFWRSHVHARLFRSHHATVT